MDLISLLKLAGFTEDDFVKLKNTFDNLEATAERSKRIEEKLDTILLHMHLTAEISGIPETAADRYPPESDAILFPAEDQKQFDDMQDNFTDAQHNNSNIGKS